MSVSSDRAISYRTGDCRFRGPQSTEAGRQCYLITTSARHSPTVPQAACPTCRVESMEAQLQQLEERGRDRAVALRAILRDDKQIVQLLAQHGDGQLALRVGHVLSCRHRRPAGWLAGWMDGWMVGWSGRVPGWLAGLPFSHCPLPGIAAER